MVVTIAMNSSKGNRGINLFQGALQPQSLVYLAETFNPIVPSAIPERDNNVSTWVVDIAMESTLKLAKNQADRPGTSRSSWESRHAIRRGHGAADHPFTEPAMITLRSPASPMFLGGRPKPPPGPSPW